MNENTKTILFVIAAIAAVAGAVLGRPGRVGVEAPDQIGKVLFPEFEDPSDAESLKIVSFDEQLGDVSEFSIAKKAGQWVIPSHNDYPADATDNLKVAANMFVSLKVINVAGDQNKLHSTFGVVEPNLDEADSTIDGLGKLVSMKDAKGNRLAELIIGKEVKGQAGQRYARIPGQDRVYTVELDPEKLSTSFGDWVKQDVLELNAIDIAQMQIRDYSVTPVMSREGSVRFEKEQRLQMQVSWNADDFKWILDELAEFRGGQLQPTELLDNEELDKTRLDEMKNALANLEIVDVSRKPDILREGLREGETEITDREGFNSLLNRGFFPGETPSELVSSDGEVTIITKDGVRITLRFGGIASADSEDGESKLNRFVMLTAAVDEASIPRPGLEDLPDDDEASTTAEESSSGEEQGTADGSDDAAAEGESDAADKDVDAERDRITKDNQRKLDEYNEKKKAAQDKVNDLNFRFADWYYVISEEVYRDIHLGRPDVITVKAATADEGFGIDSFRKLEEAELEREEKDATPQPGE